MVGKTKPGVTLLFFGWMGMLLFSMVGVLLAGELTESYGDLGGAAPSLSSVPDLLMIRPWMVQYNTAVSVCHICVLLAMLLGARKYWVGDGGTYFCKLATLGFGVAIVSLAAMLLFPLVVGSGPWPMDSVEVSTVPVLVFLPVVVRTGAFAFLVMVFVFDGNKRKRMAAVGYRVVLALIIIDLAMSVWKWITTDVTVFAVFHPFSRTPLALIPWMIAGIVFLMLMWFERDKEVQP